MQCYSQSTFLEGAGGGGGGVGGELGQTVLITIPSFISEFIK